MITQTDLYRRLAGALDTIPAIDTHVHIKSTEPLARDISQVLYYHNYVSELIAGGAAESLRHPEMSGKDKVRTLIPEMKRSACSSHAWMMRELLRVVYGFNDELTEKNWESLYALSEKKRTESGRLKTVCGFAGVEKILIHLPAETMETIGLDGSVFVGLSDIQVPAMPTGAALDAFEIKTGAAVHNAKQLFDASVAYIKRGAAVGHRGLRISVSAASRIVRPGDSALQSAFDRAATNATLSHDDRCCLETLALDAALTGARESGMAVQVFIEGSFFGQLRMPSAEQELIATLHSLAATYPDVNFELYSISAPLTQSLCLFAKYVKNIYLPGVWWLCQFPSIMDSTYALRLEMLPAVKWSAFFSDAYEVEWIVGKALLTRKELARSLALKVTEGYMSEDDALAVASQVLSGSSKQLYKIP